jgi:hypothetical protein
MMVIRLFNLLKKSITKALTRQGNYLMPIRLLKRLEKTVSAVGKSKNSKSKNSSEKDKTKDQNPEN